MSFWNFLGGFAVFSMFCDMFSFKPKYTYQPPKSNYSDYDFESYSTFDSEDADIEELRNRVDEIQLQLEDADLLSEHYDELQNRIDDIQERIDDLEDIQFELDELRDELDELEFDRDLYDNNEDW